MRGLLASPLGLLIGLSLGALGGGGSILAVPALVYGAGEPARAATTTSLLVVGVAALMGLGSHWRAGRVRLGPGLVFGITGVGGNAIGTALNQQVDPNVLLLAFSGVMVAAAVGMWRNSSRGDADCEPSDADRAECARHTPPTPPGHTPPGPSADHGGAVAVREASVRTSVIAGGAWPKLLLAGTAVGLMTGFFGVGGGFVIVPALVLSLGFSMPDAVGTSLVVIAINSAIALGLRADDLDIRWADALPFLVLAIIGTVIGQRISQRIPARALTRGFVVLLAAVASYTAISAATALA